MKIASYNINGIKGRLPRLLEWLAAASPDIVCLQELKSADTSFPIAAIRKAGYGAVWSGQRAYNGVAILAKGTDPIVTRRALPGDASDKESRYIEAAIQGVLVGCIYAPNGNPQPGPRFDYKLSWLERLLAHAASLYQTELPVVLAGDYNVVPTDRDIYNAKSSWKDDALLQPAARAAYTRLLEQGWTDAVRALQPSAVIYTFWDYLREAWRRDAGLRIDHILLSEPLTRRLQSTGVDKQTRAVEGASDHAPVWALLRES
jgi:exodeoxyribonuclease-3